MIKVKIATNGELYYSTPGRNHRKIGGAWETFKRKAGVRTNVRANLKFWGGTEMVIQWPDGTKETITA